MKTVFLVIFLLPMATGWPSYACSGSTYDERSQHNLFCEEDEMINITSGRYGFKYLLDRKCNYCWYISDSCDCLHDINLTVESKLKKSCNGKKTCNFQIPKPYYYEQCYYKRRKYFYYTYSYIQYECLTVTTTLPTRSNIPTNERRVYMVQSKIQSTKPDNSKLSKSTELYTPEDRSGRTEEIVNTMVVGLNKDSPDTGVIAGSSVGCILLVMLVCIIVVFIFKRKKVRAFIDSHLKDSPRVSNPVYESPSSGYNNVVFKNDNSPSVNVVKSDDYNHLHDARNDNPMTTGNTYNHLGQMMGDYNHLHANNNSIHIDGRSDGAYNHLGMVNSKTHISDYNHLNGLKGPDNNSEKVVNANYSHLGGWKVDYNHLHGGKNEIPEADYKSEISNDDYSHIGRITNEYVVDNYHHLGNINAHMVNGDDYNNTVDTKHKTCW